MSSSAESRRGRRVLREGETGALSMASVVSPRGTVVVDQHEDGPAPEFDIEGQLAEARRAGFDEGRTAALADAHLQNERARVDAVRTMAASLAAASASVAHDRRAVVDEVVAEAVDLAFELVEVLVGDELARRDSPVRTAVARAVALAPDGEDLRVRVHPDTGLSPAELEALSSAGSISVLTDPTIERSGCVVEAGACRIDAQIGPALERVRTVLEQLRSQHDGVGTRGAHLQ